MALRGKRSSSTWPILGAGGWLDHSVSALGIDGQGACSRGQLLQAGDGAGGSEEATAGPQAGREVLWGSLSPRAAWALLP